MSIVHEKLIDKSEKNIKRFHCQIKAEDNSKRIIRGFANTRFKDRVNDIVDPNAFVEAMAIFMTNPIVLLQHQCDCPIGQITAYQINSDGLYVTAKIAEGIEDADETWALIEQGVLRALSIGFYPIEWDYDSELDASVITKLELVEISIVSIPANRESLFSVAKAFKDGTDLILIPDKSNIAVIEIKKHLAYLKAIYATLPKERKIEVDLLRIQFETIYNLDERSGLIKELERSSREILISATLRGSPSDSN